MIGCCGATKARSGAQADIPVGALPSPSRRPAMRACREIDAAGPARFYGASPSISAGRGAGPSPRMGGARCGVISGAGPLELAEVPEDRDQSVRP